MSDIAVIQKRCPMCGELKRPSEFHKNRTKKDGLHSRCKPCGVLGAKESAARRRAEMGEEAWAALTRSRTRASRKKTGDRSNKLSQAARRAAERTLHKRHSAELAQLIREERYRRGLGERTVAS